jgi:SNF2 family DNA or RNA helicase
MRSRDEMRGYQKAAAAFVRAHPRCALFMKPGLGKTVSSLTVIRDLQEELELGRVLVVGPPRVTRKTWPDEIREWQHTRKITYTLLQKAPNSKVNKYGAREPVRSKWLKDATDMHLLSADLVPWLDKETCGEHDYDAIFIDESTLFKSQKSARWKAMRRLVAKARYVVILSGTPAAQGLADLWGQFFLLDGGARLGRTESDFHQRYFDRGFGEHAGWIPKSFAETKIKERIEDITFTLLAEDYLQLPPLIEHKVMLDMDPEMQKTYKRFVREYVLEMMESGVQINAISAGALTQKLQQVANGVVLDADRKPHELHRIKLEALQDIVEEAAGQPVMVVYSHVADIARIKALYPKAVLMGNNPQTITDWNEGRIPMLLMHPKSAGHGLNLQHGGSLMVFFGNTWSAELHQQTIARLHRSGQKNAVVVHYLLTAGTIDERIMKSLTEKWRSQAEFLSSLRSVLIDEYRMAA